MNEGERINHPSFGLIGFSRVTTSGKENLFGSSITHRNYIQMEIHNAVLQRGLNQDWIFEKELVVSINLSSLQFAEAITSLNRTGIPCTITFVNGHPVIGTEIKNKRVQFDEEFKRYSAKIASKNNEFCSKIGEILSKKYIGIRDRKEILKQLDMLQSQITENIPFIKQEFTRQMNKTVLEAKTDFDAHVDAKLMSVGLVKFKEELLALTGKPIQENEEKM